ncbi:MAG: fimbria/pilus outer membrane usher protein [Candidatus Velthaea sp.]
MRAVASVWLALAFLGALALPVAAQGQRADLEILVNTVDKGETIVRIEGDDVYVVVSDLEAAGIKIDGGTRVEIGAERYVSLRSLAPGVTYTLNRDMLTLELIVQPQRLGATQLDLDPRAATVTAAPSQALGFLNYSLHADGSGGSAAFGQIGARAGEGLLTSTADIIGGRVRRGMSALSFDDQPRLVRTMIGDALISTGTLGATTVVGGIGITRTFELQPNFIRYPTPEISGTTLTPTTADIYVDGSFYRTVQLAPGQFDLRNIPVPPGASVTRVIVHDALGGEQNLSASFFAASEVLRKGVTDYAYELGFVRPNPFGIGDRYEKPALLGRYRVGASNATSLGARLELQPGLVSGGPSVDVRLPFGLFSLAGAYSAVRGLRGSAASLAYSYADRRFGVGAALLAQSAQYATLTLDPRVDRETLVSSQFVSVQLRRGLALQARHFATHFRDGARKDDLSLSATSELSNRTSLVVTADHMRANGLRLGLPGVRNSVFTTLTFSPRGASNTSVSLTSSGTGDSTVLQLQKAAPVGPGFGYSLQQNAGGLGVSLASFTERTAVGDIAGDFAARAPLRITATGGIAAFRNGIFFSPTIGQGFALVHVSGVDRMPVYLENQPIGRTDGRGDLLIPNMTAYYPNHVAINALDAPDDYESAVTESTISPRYGDGTVAELALQRVQPFTGRLVIDAHGSALIPAYGSLALVGERATRTSDLGTNGEFYFENLAPGTYSASVTYSGGACRFFVKIPGRRETLVRLGTLTCVQ